MKPFNTPQYTCPKHNKRTSRIPCDCELGEVERLFGALGMKM